MDIPEVAQLLRDGGFAVAVIFIVIGGVKGWYVWGWTFREKAKEAEEWKRAALRGTDLAEKTASTTEEGLQVLENALAQMMAARRKDALDAEGDNLRRRGES